MKPYFDDGKGIVIYHGDCREILPQLEQVDLVLTDPPYSSGGLMRSDRSSAPQSKYHLGGTARLLPDFSGDNRDQLSLLTWCSMWMTDCLRVCRPGGAIGSFIDWRNLAVMTNAVQVAGWVFRGISVWDKTEQARPVKGWFRNQAEFVVWGSLGPLATGAAVDGECAPGVFRHKVDIQEKEHITQKPLGLMLSLIGTRADWGTVLDPFCGSGTSLVAAQRLGRRGIGIEIEEHYCEIAAKRLSQFALELDVTEQPLPEQLGLHESEAV